MGVRGLRREFARQGPREERIEFQELRSVVSRLVVGQVFLKFLLPEFLEFADVGIGELHARYRSPRACSGKGGRTYRLWFDSREPDRMRREEFDSPWPHRKDFLTALPRAAPRGAA